MNVKNYQEPKKPLNSKALYPREKGITQGSQGEMYDVVHEPKADVGETLNKADIKEFGGRGGVEPTRFGDYEINGKCVDF